MRCTLSGNRISLVIPSHATLGCFTSAGYHVLSQWGDDAFLLASQSLKRPPRATRSSTQALKWGEWGLGSAKPVESTV